MNPPDAQTTAPPTALVRLTCIVPRPLGRRIIERLQEGRFRELLVEPGRAGLLVMRRSRLPFLAGPKLDSYEVDMVRCVVRHDDAEAILAAVVVAGGLHEPGRGTVYAEPIEGYGFPACPASAGDAEGEPQAKRDRHSAGADGPRRITHGLAAITCILSAPGAGDALARVALELGVCVPVVTIGEGTGMRDRLGLLRITIPPGKEVVHLVAPSHDAEGILRMLVEAGRLNRPGMGFSYIRPLTAGVLDTRLRIGRQRAAASIEQIIAAIDDLHGGTTWRRRYLDTELLRSLDRRALGRDFCELVVTSDEGTTDIVTRTAVSAGATGATTTTVRRVAPRGSDTAAAAERSVIVVPVGRRDAVVRALRSTAVAIPPCSATLAAAPAPAVYSYSPP